MLTLLAETEAPPRVADRYLDRREAAAAIMLARTGYRAAMTALAPRREETRQVVEATQRVASEARRAHAEVLEESSRLDAVHEQEIALHEATLRDTAAPVLGAFLRELDLGWDALRNGRGYLGRGMSEMYAARRRELPGLFRDVRAEVQALQLQVDQDDMARRVVVLRHALQQALDALCTDEEPRAAHGGGDATDR